MSSGNSRRIGEGMIEASHVIERYSRDMVLTPHCHYSIEVNCFRSGRGTYSVAERTWEIRPGVLVRNHGPFTWGTDAAQSVYHAVVLEQVAAMAATTLALNPASTMPQYILDKHYSRKHGPGAYYGQR